MPNSQAPSALASANIERFTLVHASGGSVAPCNDTQRPSGVAERAFQSGRSASYQAMEIGATYRVVLAANCSQNDFLCIDSNGKVSPLGAGVKIGRAMSAGSAGDVVMFVYDPSFGDALQSANPVPVTVASHGLNANDVAFPRPLAVNNSDEIVVATTNDQATHKFAGVAVGIIDSDTLSWFPLAHFASAGERTVNSGSLQTGHTYWMQEDGTIGTDVPDTGQYVPILYANSATRYHLDGDIQNTGGGTEEDANTNIGNTDMTLTGDRSLNTNGHLLTVGDINFAGTFTLGSIPPSNTWSFIVDPNGILRIHDGLGDIRYFLQKVEEFNKLTPATIGSLEWDQAKPAYVSSLTANTVLPAPTGLEEGSWMNIYLRGNAGGFVWDLSAYDFGELNDGSAFVPVQSDSAAKMDRITVQRCGTAYVAVWQRGLTHAEPS